MLSYLLNIVYIVFIFGFSFFSQKIQLNLMLGKLSKSLNKLKTMRDKAKDEAVSAIVALGKPETDPKPRIEALLQFFAISPNSMDPSGVVNRLEHLVNTADTRVKEEVKALAPSADEKQIQNLQNLVETARGLNSLYRTVRHHYLAGKKGGNIYNTVQIQMELPMIMEEAEAYFSFIDAFKQGKPIGDGVGPLVASKMIADSVVRELAEDTIVAEVSVEGRRVFVTKAKGPGGTVGKVGDSVGKLVEEQNGNVSMIVMVDAGLKLEGEDSGYVVEGVGAAIGGVGVEKFKIEEAATKHKIPVYAMVVRQSLKEVLAPMTDKVTNSVDDVIKRIGRVIRERTKEGSTVLVVGVGNTIGIA
ncbi:MAG: DUF1512 domain-containing protein [Candidatus Bathyarchaeota archaeon]|nr:DUF1512 domain-containing protein [Candidatus Bathyarchaeum sp.]